MNRFQFVLAALLAGPLVAGVSAQPATPDYPSDFGRRNLGGPRIGLTFIPGNGELVQRLTDKGVGRVISQFGWHFEHRVVFHGDGPAFVLEFIPMLGGVEYAIVVPSLNFMTGIRFPGGFEFGMGPNVSAGGKRGITSALTIAVGKSFDYGGVSIPVNVAFVTNPSGNRISLIVGYAI
jgi:hypothetical protein